MNKNTCKLVGLLCAFIYFSIWNWIKDVEGYSCWVGAVTIFIYFMFESIGEDDE